MQKLSSFGRGKKFRPKKSLTSLLHAALQLDNVSLRFLSHALSSAITQQKSRVHNLNANR